jgi:hypothetical protein
MRGKRSSWHLRAPESTPSRAIGADVVVDVLGSPTRERAAATWFLASSTAHIASPAMDALLSKNILSVQGCRAARSRVPSRGHCPTGPTPVPAKPTPRPRTRCFPPRMTRAADNSVSGSSGRVFCDRSAPALTFDSGADGVVIDPNSDWCTFNSRRSCHGGFAATTRGWKSTGRQARQERRGTATPKPDTSSPLRATRSGWHRLGHEQHARSPRLSRFQACPGRTFETMYSK